MFKNVRECKYLVTSTGTNDNDADTKEQENDGADSPLDDESKVEEEAMDELEALPPEEYQFGIHEVYAAMWCNSQIYLEMIRILSIYETKHNELSKLNEVWECPETKNNLKECIFEILRQILGFIRDKFIAGDAEFFKQLMNMLMDCEKSIQYLLNWFERQELDPRRMELLNRDWRFIELYKLCYSPFTQIETIKVGNIQQNLGRIKGMFRDNQFASEKKVRGLMSLMRDICKRLEFDADETEEIVQYAIQRYITSFAFPATRNGEDVQIPNIDFIQYMIGLICKEERRRDSTGNDDDEFTANSFTKQQIAVQILNILPSEDGVFSFFGGAMMLQ